MPNQTAWERGSDIVSRTLAIVLMMAVPGLAGSWCDRKLGTSFLTPIGFILGVIFGVFGLIYTLKRIQGELPTAKPLSSRGDANTTPSTPAASQAMDIAPDRSGEEEE